MVQKFYYPGQTTTGDKNLVTKYEWTLPEGWKSGTQTGVFTTSSESINITTNNVGTGTVKVRGVNQGAEFDKSGIPLYLSLVNLALRLIQLLFLLEKLRLIHLPLN